jgi:branched-subunit amino acid permease
MSENHLEKTNEREFQLELLKIQQGSDVFGSIISVIASIFVAIITTSITLLLALSSYISTGLSVSIIGYQIATAIISVMASWIIFLIFRNRKIKEIEKKFHLNQFREPKPTKTKPK